MGQQEEAGRRRADFGVEGRVEDWVLLHKRKSTKCEVQLQDWLQLHLSLPALGKGTWGMT